MKKLTLKINIFTWEIIPYKLIVKPNRGNNYRLNYFKLFFLCLEIKVDYSS